MFMNVPVFSYTYAIYVTINRGLEFEREGTWEDLEGGKVREMI